MRNVALPGLGMTSRIRAVSEIKQGLESSGLRVGVLKSDTPYVGWEEGVVVCAGTGEAYPGSLRCRGAAKRPRQVNSV